MNRIISVISLAFQTLIVMVISGASLALTVELWLEVLQYLLKG